MFSLTLDEMMYALDRRDIHDVTDGSDDGSDTSGSGASHVAAPTRVGDDDPGGPMGS